MWEHSPAYLNQYLLNIGFEILWKIFDFARIFCLLIPNDGLQLLLFLLQGRLKGFRFLLALWQCRFQVLRMVGDGKMQNNCQWLWRALAFSEWQLATPNNVKRTVGELFLRMERKKPLSDPWRHTIPSWHPSSSSARLSTERNIIQHKYKYMYTITHTQICIDRYMLLELKKWCSN